MGPSALPPSFTPARSRLTFFFILVLTIFFPGAGVESAVSWRRGAPVGLEGGVRFCSTAAVSDTRLSLVVVVSGRVFG